MSFTLRRFVSRNSPIASYRNLVAYSSRNYSGREYFNEKTFDYPEEAQQEKDAVIQEMVRKVLLKRTQVGSKPSETLRHLFATIHSEQDAIYTIQQASRVSGRLRQEGYRNVGYNQEKLPVHVAITGAAGQIGYSLIPRIASGEMLGLDQPVILHLIDVPEALKVAEGLALELEDCAFPLLRGVKITADINQGLKDVDYALFVGAKPRGKGQERADLLKENGKIFVETGKALARNAKPSVLSLVVGNPANTNCLVLSANAKGVDPTQFSALTRLDQDRAYAQLAQYANVPVGSISHLNIWGNHSPTMYPDLANATIAGQPALQVVKDAKWIDETFIPTVGKRGAQVIAARGKSSAASAADASIKHMRDWVLGTGEETVSMAVWTDKNPYGIAGGIYSSFPVVCLGNGKYRIVEGLKLDASAKKKIQVSIDELVQEQKAVSALLK